MVGPIAGVERDPDDPERPAIGSLATLGVHVAAEPPVRSSPGLGQRIHIAISLFLEHQLLTLILATYLMVTLVDALSGWLRRRVI